MSVAEFGTTDQLAQASTPVPARNPIWPLAVVLAGLGLAGAWTTFLAYGIVKLVAMAI